MAATTRRPARRLARTARAKNLRYTVDASVFVNAFNLHEEGHTQSLAILSAIQEGNDPVIVPTLLPAEIASAVARASGDSTGALNYANATAALPHLILIPLSPATARQAAELAANHRLRAADAVYVAVARRYGTTLVSRDEEQRSRGAAVVTCQTPEEALRTRRTPKPSTRRRRGLAHD
jgi:predicted nucleic acid-binding protein